MRRDATERALAAELDNPERATAIYAFNDEQALLALEVLRDRGVSLPVEMALIGCDDSPAAEQIRPRLTTVRFDDHGRWREIAGHLHAMISGVGAVPAGNGIRPDCDRRRDDLSAVADGAEGAYM